MSEIEATILVTSLVYIVTILGLVGVSYIICLIVKSYKKKIRELPLNLDKIAEREIKTLIKNLKYLGFDSNQINSMWEKEMFKRN